jgi:hypothetical protein
METMNNTTTVYEVRYFTYADLQAGHTTFIVRCKTMAQAEDTLHDWYKSGKTQYQGVDIHKVKVESYTYA